MAESNKQFEETFHHTQPTEFYDDLNSASFPITHEKQQESNPFYPEQTAPPVPEPRSKQQVYGQMINPKSFDGKTNPRIWLNHYETVAEANLWNDDLKLRRVIGSLDGAAQNWFMNLKLTRQSLNWNQFKDALINRFTNTMDDLMLADNILRTRQKNNDFDSYWEQKLGLIKITTPEMNDKDLMHHMFMGLNKELRSKVLDKLIVRKCETPNELHALIKELIDIELYQQEENYSPQRKNRYHSNAYVEVKKEWKPWNKPTGSYQPNTWKIEKEIREMKDLLTEAKNFTDADGRKGEIHTIGARLNSQGVYPGYFNNKIGRVEKDLNDLKLDLERNVGKWPRKKPNNQMNRDKDWKDKIECFKCHSKGHYANECNKNCMEKAKTTKVKQGLTCFVCNKEGHFAKNCPSKKANKANRDDRENYNKRD